MLYQYLRNKGFVQVKIDFLGYHGTNQKSFHYIQKNGFKKKVSDISFPNDLGDGIYFYIDRGVANSEAIENARKYVKKYKYNYNGKIVLEVPICVEENKVLDFNDKDTSQSLECFITENREKIDEELNKYNRLSAVFKRGNFDGIAIELYIDYFKANVDLVLKDTFTKFDDYKTSNFCNGREVCVRNMEAISISEITYKIVL